VCKSRYGSTSLEAAQELEKEQREKGTRTFRRNQVIRNLKIGEDGWEELEKLAKFESERDDRRYCKAMGWNLYGKPLNELDPEEKEKALKELESDDEEGAEDDGGGSDDEGSKSVKSMKVECNYYVCFWTVYFGYLC
jgi:hypothetical protein